MKTLRKRHNGNKPAPLTEEEKQYIRTNRGVKPVREITAHLRCNVRKVYQLINEEGLPPLKGHKPKEGGQFFKVELVNSEYTWII